MGPARRLIDGSPWTYRLTVPYRVPPHRVHASRQSASYTLQECSAVTSSHR